jgi:hypothetical protein
MSVEEKQALAAELFSDARSLRKVADDLERRVKRLRQLADRLDARSDRLDPQEADED